MIKPLEIGSSLISKISRKIEKAIGPAKNQLRLSLFRKRNLLFLFLEQRHVLRLDASFRNNIQGDLRSGGWQQEYYRKRG